MKFRFLLYYFAYLNLQQFLNLSKDSYRAWSFADISSMASINVAPFSSASVNVYDAIELSVIANFMLSQTPTHFMHTNDRKLVVLYSQCIQAA